MDVFFDVDFTILSKDGTLRPHTHQLFENLREEGHKVYLWSGIGLRHEAVEHHGLTDLLSGIFQKPIYLSEMRDLARFGINKFPDFVVDDYEEIVEAFGGFVIKPFFPGSNDDQELYRVHQAIREHVEFGHSALNGYRQQNGVLNS